MSVLNSANQFRSSETGNFKGKRPKENSPGRNSLRFPRRRDTRYNFPGLKESLTLKSSFAFLLCYMTLTLKSIKAHQATASFPPHLRTPCWILQPSLHWLKPEKEIMRPRWDHVIKDCVNRGKWQRDYCNSAGHFKHLHFSCPKVWLCICHIISCISQWKKLSLQTLSWYM